MDNSSNVPSGIRVLTKRCAAGLEFLDRARQTLSRDLGYTKGVPVVDERIAFVFT